MALGLHKGVLEFRMLVGYAMQGGPLATKQITLQIDNIYIAMAMAWPRRWWQEKLASNISR